MKSGGIAVGGNKWDLFWQGMRLKIGCEWGNAARSRQVFWVHLGR